MATMIKTSIQLQDLRRSIYIKAKTDKSHRFWGLYVHICKKETLEEAYALVRANNGSSGVDGVTFAEIEKEGLSEFLDKLRVELQEGIYYPQRNRIKEIPKANGKMRRLGIPTIRDRVVQGALKLILEPVFEADFQDGSYGYRPKRTAHQAVERVAQAIVTCKTRVIDLDLKTYFDTVKHSILLNKVAQRIRDDKVMRLLKLILKASGSQGVPQGGVISPLLSNIYLTEVDCLLEKAKAVTREGQYSHIEYSRFADDQVILVDGHPRWDWLWMGVIKRLREVLSGLQLEINEEKTKFLDLTNGDCFSFLGFEFRRTKSIRGKWRANYQPLTSARNKVIDKVRSVFEHYRSQPLERVAYLINPILRGWVQYFRVGNSGKTFGYVKDWFTKKIRRHIMHSKKRSGFGWKRWSNKELYGRYNIYSDFHLVSRKAIPA